LSFSFIDKVSELTCLKLLRFFGEQWLDPGYKLCCIQIHVCDHLVKHVGSGARWDRDFILFFPNLTQNLVAETFASFGRLTHHALLTILISQLFYLLF
jgi:hypothetical protein